ncbi:MAG: YciI family protein [Acidimicrobiales bacterium]
MAFFVLTTVHGPNWDVSRYIREQDAWDEHAAFMDRLVEAGFVILGGPLGDGERALLVIEAADEREIGARFADDPWASMGLLRIGAIEPWTIWLDGRRGPSPGGWCAPQATREGSNPRVEPH